MIYNFKTISVVPSSKDFVDVILSKTQRKTPTVVRKGWKISRIRKFYVRKIKFTQQNFHDKITVLIDGFPRLDDIHPFYADLINVLYSRDHYKLALGQISTARTLVDKIGKDYLRLLKFSDSLYRSKQLKRAALGRMCTIVKKLNASLSYLEQVRQHLSRLPSIDPNTRTLMITGYPNVGKSSFINKISRANVEVQPYAFTTKSLFVGHTDYKYLRWQVIDTPGILDHPLEDRNTIEMQAVTALAHLHSSVLFFVDISESCGYTIKQQVSLFNNIKPLFANKPLLIVANKTDLRKIESLDKADRKLLDSMTDDGNVKIVAMSNISEEGISVVKQTACDMLLEHRVERKLKGKRITDVINQIQVAVPVKRDAVDRSVTIPASVRARRAATKAGAVAEPKRTEKDIELEHGGPGLYYINMQKNWKLANDEWKFDVVPEIMDGKNVSDFIDPDIEARLDALEREEEALEAAAAQLALEEDEDSDLDDEQKEMLAQIRDKKKMQKTEATIKSSQNGPTLPRKYKTRTMEGMAAHLDSMGVDSDKMRDRLRREARSRSRSRRNNDHNSDTEEEYDDESDDGMQDDDDERETRGRKRTRSSSRTRASSTTRDARSASRSRARTVDEPPRESEGYSDKQQKKKARKEMKRAQSPFQRMAMKGEADHRVFDMKPKHLYSGKRGIGKTDRR